MLDIFRTYSPKNTSGRLFLSIQTKESEFTLEAATRRCSEKKIVIKSYQIFPDKYLQLSTIFEKLEASGLRYYKTVLGLGYFLGNFPKTSFAISGFFYSKYISLIFSRSTKAKNVGLKFVFTVSNALKSVVKASTQPIFTCSKSTMDTQEQCVKSVQS